MWSVIEYHIATGCPVLQMYSLILGIKDEVQEYRKFQDVFIT